MPPGEAAAREALRRLLLEAMSSLNPTRTAPGNNIATRRYQHLVLRYEHGATPEQVCASLGVSPRQARRDHHEAVDALARYLWQIYRETHPLTDTDGLEYQVSMAPPEPAPAVASLESELNLLTPTMKSGLKSDLAPLQEVVSSALTTVAKLAETRTVRCHHEVAGDSANLLVNRSGTRQMLILLLAFAIESPGVTTVTLSVQRSRQRGASIIVEATLAGGVNFQLKAFGRSMESDDRLRVSRRLIETLGGDFDLASKNDASFQLLVQIPPASLPTILAVDDNPDMLRLLSRYIVGTPYRLLTATTAESALRLVDSANPAAIVLDLMMPTRDGWEILEEIQRNPNAREISVIVCSVLRDRELALSLGAADFLSKPVTRSALLTTLSRFARVP